MHETLDEILELLTDWRLYAVLLVVLLPVFGYWLLRDGNGTDAVGEQLREAVTAQHRITETVNDATVRVDSLRERTSGNIRQIEAISRNITDAGELIADCQRILGEVRTRAEAETEAR